MRRVLLIHYHFLPVHNVAVKHLLGYARYLPAFGWQPLVLTHDWESLDGAGASWGLSWEPELEASLPIEIHRVRGRRPLPLRRPGDGDAWLVRKMRSVAHLAAGSYPDAFSAWTRPAVARAVDLARQQRIDAVLTYCPPETNHVVGSRVARALDVPWVPFFGDLYGFFLAPLPSVSLSAMISRWYHRRWLAPAAAMAAVSPYMVEYLANTYRKRTALVLVGFEPDEFAGPAGVRDRRDRLVISHIGSLYPGNQRPEIFMDGLDLFLERHPEAGANLEVRFVGSKCDDDLRALVRGRRAGRVVTVQPKVKSPVAAAMVADSDALLAFNCSAFRDRHGTLSYPSKIFEALGARRPVLAIPADHDWVDALLSRTNGGTMASTGVDVARVLGGWYSTWTQTGRIPFEGREPEIAAFTHERQAGELARLLGSVAGSKPF